MLFPNILLKRPNISGPQQQQQNSIRLVGAGHESNSPLTNGTKLALCHRATHTLFYMLVDTFAAGWTVQHDFIFICFRPQHTNHFHARCRLRCGHSHRNSRMTNFGYFFLFLRTIRRVSVCVTLEDALATTRALHYTAQRLSPAV